MYIPKHFLESRFEVLHAFMPRHPLATICVDDGSGLEADHVPLTLRSEPGPHGVLLGHVARANPLWRKAGDGLDCLVVYQGPQHYISPNWYATKAETGRVVPTWNYEVARPHSRSRRSRSAARAARGTDDGARAIADAGLARARRAERLYRRDGASRRGHPHRDPGPRRQVEAQPEPARREPAVAGRARDDSSALQMAEAIAERTSGQP